MPTVQDDVLEITVTHDNDTSGEQINRYQFQSVAIPDVDDADMLDDVAELIETLYNVIAGIISIRNVLRDVKVFNVTQNRLIGSTDADTYEGGTAADPAGPQGVAFQVYFPTGVPHVTLSKYLPSPNQARYATDGTISVAALAILTSFAEDLMVSFTLGNSVLVYGYLSPKTLGWIEPDSFVVPAIPAYQRRRKPGRGN